MNNFDQSVMGALSVAQTTAVDRKHTELAPEHLLWGLINTPQTVSSKKLKNIRILQSHFWISCPNQHAL